MKFVVVCLLLLTAITTQAQKTVVVADTQILPHPRLLFTDRDEESVKAMMKSIPLMDSLYLRLIEQSERLLLVPVQPHSLSDLGQMLSISREEVSRIITLSMAYRLSKDIRFAKKAEEELVNVCSYPDWNPDHYLDVAEMALAVGIGYDWLYDVLSPKTKKMIVKSIRKNALEHPLNAIEKGMTFHSGTSNWNVVCNTGVAIGALAIAEDYPEVATKIIGQSVRNVPNCMGLFAPDGACYEGPAYWGYTINYFSILCRALTDNFGHDFGLSDMDGIRPTALYFIHTFSPSGKAFNFADAAYPSNRYTLEYSENPLFFYFSRRYDQPETAAHYRKVLSRALKRNNISDRFFFLSIPWFDNSAYDSQADTPKLQVFESKGVDIVTFNGDRQTKNSIYMIAKSGTPNLSHQHLDVGTFVTEVNGIRWSDDLGSDSYSLPGFWNSEPDGSRWRYFRNTNFSHNTLTIDGKIQYSAGRSYITDYDTESAQPYATIDMAPVYKDQARTARRTFRMLDDVTVSVRDSVVLHSLEQKIEWTMITGAAVKCNGNVATLNKDGQTFYVKITSPAGVVFTASPARNLIPDERSVEGFTALNITLTGSRTHLIEVVMSSNAPAPAELQTRREEVKSIMRRVADWQLDHFEEQSAKGSIWPNSHAKWAWTNATMYLGLEKCATLTGDEKYWGFLKDIGRANRWQTGPDIYFADDICVTQLYCELYERYKDPEMLKHSIRTLDSIMTHPATGSLSFHAPGAQRRWCWCDALFMAPTSFARLGKITGNNRYFDFLFSEFKATYDSLYCKRERLFLRDTRYLNMKEENGKPVFWGRGNGWVAGGLTIIIDHLPAEHHSREWFIDLFKEMMPRIAELQDPEGFWHPSMLDPEAYPMPETSASGFFTYAMLWGINRGYLDSRVYGPVAEKSWNALCGKVAEDGKLGFVQPIGADPKTVSQHDTEVYGVGAFLLAGCEMYKFLEP